MKTVIYAVMALLIVITFTGKVFSQEKTDIKQILTGIIELSKAKKYDEAAKYVAYCADEKKKEYKTLQPGDKNQLSQVTRILKRIGALAEVSSSFSIGDSAPMNIGGNSFQKISVEFISGSQKIVTKFNFVALNGTLLLAEVE